MKDTLVSLRDEIDRVDERLLPLIVERMEISERIADVKKEKGLSVYDAEREKVLLQRIRQKAGETWGDYACEIYRRIFEMSRACQAERQNGNAD